ncbi:hypothetical protein [Streptomyces sp. NPDC088115]|uniref:hypothetical protein n=1 Tax=Streptomyces sp. NPDC088115 TaxID=3365824 RepID=UPI003807A6E6
MSSEIRDPGRWLLGVALPRWGCGHLDCESGIRWSNGACCAACEEVVADKFAARRRAHRIAQGLCPDYGSEPGPSGTCRDCELQRAIDGGASSMPAPREPEGPPRSSCGDCGCRIFLTGRAIEDGLCRLCREEARALAASSPAVPEHPARSAACPGAGGVPCGRTTLPTRGACARHRAQELALTDAEAS